MERQVQKPDTQAALKLQLNVKNEELMNVKEQLQTKTRDAKRLAYSLETAINIAENALHKLEHQQKHLKKLLQKLKFCRIISFALAVLFIFAMKATSESDERVG